MKYLWKDKQFFILAAWLRLHMVMYNITRRGGCCCWLFSLYFKFQRFFFFSMVCRGMRGKEKNPTNTQQQVLIIFQGDFVVVLQNNPFGNARSTSISLCILRQYIREKPCILILPGKPRQLFMTWKIKFKVIIQTIESLRGSMDFIIYLMQNKIIAYSCWN